MAIDRQEEQYVVLKIHHPFILLHIILIHKYLYECYYFHNVKNTQFYLLLQAGRAIKTFFEI